MNTKLIKWFGIWLGFMLIIILFTLPDERPDKLELVSFQTNRSSELYFRNVRSFFYTKQEEAGGSLDVYRLKSLFDPQDSLNLPFVIYHDWRGHQAYIRLDTSFHSLESPKLIFRNDSIHSIAIPSPLFDNEQHYIFARSVYRTLTKEQGLGIQSGDSRIFWIDPTIQKSIRQCLSDYFKLLDKV